MVGNGNHTDDTIERLLEATPSYVASALGRIALCLQMDFAPYIGLFINVTERCIPHECDAVLLMTEDRPVDMDGWEVAETVDDFGTVPRQPPPARLCCCRCSKCLRPPVYVPYVQAECKRCTCTSETSGTRE